MGARHSAHDVLVLSNFRAVRSLDNLQVKVKFRVSGTAVFHQRFDFSHDIYHALARHGVDLQVDPRERCELGGSPGVAGLHGDDSYVGRFLPAVKVSLLVPGRPVPDRGQDVLGLLYCVYSGFHLNLVTAPRVGRARIAGDLDLKVNIPAGRYGNSAGRGLRADRHIR